MHIRSTSLVLLFTAASSWACDAGSSPASGPNTACGELLCGTSGKADALGVDGTLELDEEVRWELTLDGGSDELSVSGRVRVRFFGDELPLTDGGPLAPETASFLQPAVLEFDAPSFDGSATTTPLSFYALLQSWDGGQTYSVNGTHGQGALLSTTLPDAVATFNAAYDHDTREGVRVSDVDADLAFSAIRFERDSVGQLAVAHVSMAFAEPFGDTTDDHKAVIGRRAPGVVDAGVTATISTQRPAVEESGHSSPSSYFVRPGTARVLDAQNLREAASAAADQSFESRTTVAVFERGGRLVTADLEFGSGSSMRLAVTGHYEPNILFRRSEDDGPVLLVDHALAYFALGMSDLSSGEPVGVLMGKLH